MTLTEMFNICDTCIYASCFCGNEPENCIAYNTIPAMKTMLVEVIQQNGKNNDKRKKC